MPNDTAPIQQAQEDSNYTIPAPEPLYLKDAAQTSTFQDFATQIYQKNLELLEQRRRTEQLLYNVSEIVFAVDRLFKITFLNHAAEDYFKLSPEKAIGDYIDDVVKIKSQNDQDLRVSDYCFQVDPQKAFLDKAEIQTPSGDLYVKLKTNVITRGDEVTECVVTLSDINKEIQLDKSKDEFVNITSHELRTPLTIIKSYLWMLANKGGELNEKQKDYLAKASSGSERMLALINDTLNVARIEQNRINLSFETIDLNQVIAEVAEEFLIKASERGIKLKVDVANNLEKVYVDRARLREIFLNLMSNAIKYTFEGGVLLHAENYTDNFVKIIIKDTGRGIKTEDLPRLFNKFGRLDNSFSTMAEVGGTGLGLYITKSLVEKNGGQIGVESEGLGKGSTFWFTLVKDNSKDKIKSLV